MRLSNAESNRDPKVPVFSILGTIQQCVAPSRSRRPVATFLGRCGRQRSMPRGKDIWVPRKYVPPILQANVRDPVRGISGRRGSGVSIPHGVNYSGCGLGLLTSSTEAGPFFLRPCAAARW